MLVHCNKLVVLIFSFQYAASWGRLSNKYKPSTSNSPLVRINCISLVDFVS